MELDRIFSMFLFAFFTLVPSKLFFTFSALAYEKSVLFFAVNVIVFLVFAVSLHFLKEKEEKIYIVESNVCLAITSLLVCISFLWHAFTLLVDTSTSYPFFQSILTFISSSVSSAAFFLVFLSFFYGKNKISSVPILLFFPVFWFIIKMVSFLSISDETPDQYEVFLDSFLLLFLLNHIRVFVNVNRKYAMKKHLLFGFESVLLSFMFCFPGIVLDLKNYNGLTSVSLASLAVKSCLCFYILAFLLSIWSKFQAKKSKYFA